MSDGMIEKWGRPVAERGFAQIPNYLLQINQFLADEAKLAPVELLVLIQLVGAWWKKDDKPFPAMRTLAARVGASERQVQRAINRLVSLGLIVRTKTRHKGLIASNVYDLAPLVELLTEVAKIFPNEFPRRLLPPGLKAANAANVEKVDEEV